nr:hypothetical protein pPsy0462b_00025 [Pseudomonas syringae]
MRFDRRQARAEARLDLKMRYKRYREGWENLIFMSRIDTSKWRLGARQ